jgi:hypothetical protein
MSRPWRGQEGSVLLRFGFIHHNRIGNRAELRNTKSQVTVHTRHQSKTKARERSGAT